jgi:hypothetical protein
MTAAARARLGAPQLVETPLFESDGCGVGTCYQGSAEAVLNTDFGAILMLRAVAWRPGSASLGPKWRPYQPRLAVTGRGKGLGSGQGRGGVPGAVYSQRRIDLGVDRLPTSGGPATRRRL